MIPQPYQRHTAYGQYVYEQMSKIMAHANVYYTLEQLAYHANLKPTHSFRRQVGRLVVEQHLSKFVVPRATGGFVSVYARFGSNAPTPSEYWTPTPAPKYQRDQEGK